jgi:hypothetical protein
MAYSWSDLLAPFSNLPDVWGEGAIFAFSGLDGETNVASGFVATYAHAPYGLLFHTPQRRVLDMTLPDALRVRVATGDVVGVEAASGDLLITYRAWHTLVGILPPGARLRLRMERGDEAVQEGLCWLSVDVEHEDVLALAQQGARFALAYGHRIVEACERVRTGLNADAWHEAAQRLALYARVPALPDAQRSKLLKKCVSVSKVNTLAPEGAIQRLWSTPDRVPHRDMWIWDTIFHSFAQNLLFPDVAWSCLQAELDTQQADGLIPMQCGVTGPRVAFTQAPILAWGVWEHYCVSRNKARLAYAFPRLERYLEWDCVHRDLDGNGLLEWQVGPRALSRAPESGMDNSPRFDTAEPLDAVDFSTFAALDMGYVARIAAALELRYKAAYWRERSKRMSAAIHTSLWDEQDGFYYDRDLQRGLTRVRAVSGFLPLLLDDIPPAHVQRLVQTLGDPAHFATAFPVPSLAASHPAFSTDMWRGPTWLNYNYCLIRGLRKQGYPAEADDLAAKTIQYVNDYYTRYGVIFEFYDATDVRPPVDCDRKGPHQSPYDIRCKYDSIRDYHWSAALTACLLLGAG